VARVYVGIGSNIERERHIRAAVRELAGRHGPLILSSVYESAPVGFAGDNFYNLVAGFDTKLDAESLIAELHALERASGRRRTSARFGPRTLDLDLLLYDDLVRHDGTVDVPRREILDYAFVLQPLADIAPNRVHPETGRTLGAHWSELRERLTPLRETGFDPHK
jgi:2-amino-4-hydroxy-6-hydroxymethyldihydropteridine diphosphokinase